MIVVQSKYSGTPVPDIWPPNLSAGRLRQIKNKKRRETEFVIEIDSGWKTKNWSSQTVTLSLYDGGVESLKGCQGIVRVGNKGTLRVPFASWVTWLSEVDNRVLVVPDTPIRVGCLTPIQRRFLAENDVLGEKSLDAADSRTGVEPPRDLLYLGEYLRLLEMSLQRSAGGAHPFIDVQWDA